jgi:hypothetical protein
MKDYYWTNGETAYTNDEPFTRETAVNMDNETFSGYGFNLKCVEGGISSWSWNEWYVEFRWSKLENRINKLTMDIE